MRYVSGLKFAALPLATAIALVGCGEQKDEPKVDEIVLPKPGEYKQTITILEMSIPGMPPELANMMKDQMSAGMTATDCLTEEESKEALKQLTKAPDANDECDFSKYEVSAGRLDAAMTCASEGGGNGSFVLAGTFSETGTDMTIEGDQEDPNIPGGKMHMKMHMVSERIGECKAEPAAEPSAA